MSNVTVIDNCRIAKFPAPEGDYREIVLDYMKKMSSIKWTPKETFTIIKKGPRTNVDLTYEKGKTYYGVSYSGMKATLDQFEQFVENGEFDNNGHANDISHKRGVISMARSGNQYYPSLAYNTASSQFFICNADYPYLDGDYAAFGYVIAGLDVVDSITADGMQYTSSALNGAISDKKNQPKIISVVEITEEEAMSYVK